MARYLDPKIEYLPSEQVPDNPGRKNSLVDVKCRDRSRRVFIIGMTTYYG